MHAPSQQYDNDAYRFSPNGNEVARCCAESIGGDNGRKAHGTHHAPLAIPQFHRAAKCCTVSVSRACLGACRLHQSISKSIGSYDGSSTSVRLAPPSDFLSNAIEEVATHQKVSRETKIESAEMSYKIAALSAITDFGDVLNETGKRRELEMYPYGSKPSVNFPTANGRVPIATDPEKGLQIF